MKVIPVASPLHIQTPQTTNNSPARAAAVAKLEAAMSGGATQGNAQEHPVPNPSNVSPEDVHKASAQVPETKDVLDSTEVTETPVETKEAKPEQDPALKRQFEQLARQERILRSKAQQQAKDIQAREAALNAREAAIAAKDAEYRDNYISKARFKQDRLGALAETGVTYDEITQDLLNQVPTDPRINATISRLEAKIQELEGKTQAQETTWKQQQEDSYKSAVRQIETDAKSLVKSDPEAFEAVSKTPGAVREAVRLIEEVWKRDGVLLSTEEALQEVENELVDRTYKSASTINKVNKRLAESSTKTQQAQKTAQPQQTQSPMKTLTNSAASTRQLSAKERAMLAFKGELK